MSAITAADLKLGGRLVAACDAIGQGHLRRAAGIFNEIADDLNGEAEGSDGLLSEDDGPSSPIDGRKVLDRVAELLTPPNSPPSPPAHMQPAAATATDLQSCSRGAHFFGQPDPVSGWRTCGVCGNVNVAPPGDGPIDMGARNL